MRTEEEQVAAIKSWWKENGKSLVLTVAVVLAGVFGWKAWQQKQANDAEAASIIYQNLVQAVAVSVQQGAADDVTTANHLGQQLKNDYDSSEYAKLGSMLLARIAVDQKNYDAAMKELNWVLENEPSQEMTSVILMRKAQVYLAQGKPEEGLAELNKVSDEAFKAAALELSGDLQLAKGDKSAARKAYEQALLANSDSGSRQLLTIKLDDLAAEQEG
ncbi:YfgM family protein [Neptunomonas phycophila]|uniref:YfgM family protein n=1 Tax=Neptunomonas phycophila TaxID=1572645 RepID=UPI0023F9C01A|nr:tetratricopeptide repeat protein [Neptunomonas phycophila]